MMRRRWPAGGRHPTAVALLWAAAAVLGSAFLALESTRLTTNMLVKLMVVLAGLAVSVLALQRPHWALFTLPAVAAFDRPVSVAGLSVQLTTLALVGFAPAFASRWRPACLPTPVALGAAALVAGGVVSCFFAHDPSAAISGTLIWALVINAMFGGLGMVAGSPQMLTRLGLEFGGLGALVAVLGWLQGRGVYTVVGPPYVPDRIDSSFGWYSTYGSFVAMATIVAVGTALGLAASGRPLLSMFSAGCAVISGYGTITSLSRGAVLCLGVGCAVLLLSRVRRPFALFGTSLAVGLVALFAYLLTPAATVRQLAMRFQDIQGGDELRRILQNAGRTLLMALRTSA